jgi:cytochrome c oxidase subunit 3
MSVDARHIEPHAATGPGTHDYAYRTATNRLGLWLFIISDSFVFGALLVARFYLLGNHRPHLEQFLGLIVTSVLLVSSFFTGFLLGVVGVEWQVAPFGPGDGAEGAIFYMMTGMHAFHVLTGVIILGIVLRNGLRGKYTPERHWGVEGAANYWHFVDVVWIFYYPALYLIGML